MSTTNERVLITCERDDDARPDDCDCYDAEQIKAWENNEWEYVCIMATHQRMCSAGCWHDVDDHGSSCCGFESNAGREYLTAEATEIASDCGADKGTPIVYDDTFANLLRWQK